MPRTAAHYVRALPAETLARILDAEREMRLSAAFQARLAALPSGDAWIELVAQEQQRLAVEEFPELDPRVAVKAMQIGGRVRPEFAHKSIHVRYNRAAQSTIPEGAAFRSLRVFSVTDKTHELYPGTAGCRYSIAVAASLT